MLNNNCYNDSVWNIVADVGSIDLNLLIDSTFFSCTDLQHSEKHKHAMYEFHYVTKGSAKIIIDDVYYEVSNNSYYIVKAGSYHSLIGYESDPICRYSFKFDFDINKEDCCYSEKETEIFINTLNGDFFCSRDLGYINNILSEIRFELMNIDFGGLIKAQHLISLLFISIIQHHPRNGGVLQTGYNSI